ncbi:hypothetical protein F0562_020722 [Nyssa sinensis]|uniref:Uncharacterized protein n=1 Tax=Nyssa sinensis TaxID=561372 RepID=A0A5J5BVL3_9ASTE|nr:hypothetical protein F0562_020722 [Nyssa sinensis]
MAVAQVSASLYASVRDVCILNPARTTAIPQVALANFTRIGTTFATGSPLLIWRTSRQMNLPCKAMSLSIKCEQSSQEGSSLDVWLGRLAMVGFAGGYYC